MTTPDPAQQIVNEINALKSKLSSLHQSVRLSKIRDAVEDLQVRINTAPQKIAVIRQKGYVFEKTLEEQAASLAQQWTRLIPSINQQINLQSTDLQASIRPIETRVAQLTSLARNPVAAKSTLATVQSNIKLLEDKISAVEKTIIGMYDNLENHASKLDRQLTSIEFTLSNLAEASFQFLPTEGGIAAVKAVWCKTGKEEKEDPEGILFLTDQRILFEQKEEVATKKVLFITTEKQKIQTLQWEVPVALLDQVVTSKQGLLKNEDHIDVQFQTGAPMQNVHLHIWQDCETWQAMLNKARSREFDQERVVPVDQHELEKIKSAPTQCTSCGAVLEAVLLRGQDSIKCEYCGAVMRL